jgi:hypothetical protein
VTDQLSVEGFPVIAHLNGHVLYHRYSTNAMLV